MLETAALQWPFHGTVFVSNSTWMTSSGITRSDSLGKSTWKLTQFKTKSRSHSLPNVPATLTSIPLFMVPVSLFFTSAHPISHKPEPQISSYYFPCPHPITSSYHGLLIFQLHPLLRSSSMPPWCKWRSSFPDSGKSPNCSADIHSCHFSCLFSISQHNLFKTSLTMFETLWRVVCTHCCMAGCPSRQCLLGGSTFSGPLLVLKFMWALRVFIP